MHFLIGIRRALRSPFFVSLAVVSLGLSLASALFGTALLRSVVVNDLPYREPARLVRVGHLHSERGPIFAAFSYDDFQDLLELPAFQSAAAIWHSPGQTVANAIVESQAVQVEVAYVSEGFFDTFAPRMAKGNGWTLGTPAEQIAESIVVSADAWANLFGKRPDILGRRVSINGVSYAVGAVAAPAVNYPTSGVQFWMPLSAVTEKEVPHNRANRWLDVVVRLAPAVNTDVAKSQLATLMSRLAREFPGSNSRFNAPVIEGLFEAILGSWRHYASIIGVTAFLALMAACANFASLFRTRLAVRAASDFVQMSLGVRPLQLLVQRGSEVGFVLTLASTLGAALAIFAVEYSRSAHTHLFPQQAGLSIDPASWLSVLCIANLACFLGALASLKHRSLLSHTRAVQGRVRSMFLAAQIALVFALTYGGFLVADSFVQKLYTPLGISLDDRVTFRIRLRTDTYTSPAQIAVARQQLIDRLSQIPGVISVAASKTTPLGQVGERYGIVLDESRSEWATPDWGFVMVTPEYFSSLGVLLVEGEEFGAIGADESVLPVVVNEAFVARYFGSESPVGREMRTGLGRSVHVTGVVRNVRHLGPGEAARPAIYAPLQAFGRASFSIILRTPRRDLEALGAEVRSAIANVDAQLGMGMLDSLSQVAERLTERIRLLTGVFTILVVMSTLVTAAGIFSLLALSINEGMREFAVRAAMGASPLRQIRRVYSYAAALSVAGCVGGAALAVALGRYLSSMLPEIGPLHVGGFVATVCLLLTVVILAGVHPSLKVHRLPIARTLAA